MPASQAAATERRNERTIPHEPPKLKTTLKTPPKQATNPLQFVKVGPCSLYRTAQEQLQKVQEVKKIKQEVRDDPEDWQSNLDNWKSSRRKRQEHIIERVVEVKKLELEEHDRQRRRSKTFSEMMEERGNRGRKPSINLAMYQEEDANDLSDLGIGTSSGKSSVSGDTHDDVHSVLSDRDSEIERNHSDVDNVHSETIGNEVTTSSVTTATTTVVSTTATATTTTTAPTVTTATKKPYGNGFHNHTHNHTHSHNHNHSYGHNHSHNNHNHNQEYDSATTATTSSPEPEEYTYEGAIRGYMTRVCQNISRKILPDFDAKLESLKVNSSEENKAADSTASAPVVKVDILKRREIFEKASQKSAETKTSNRLSGDFTGAKSIRERLSNLERQKHGGGDSPEDEKATKAAHRLSGDMNSIRERLTYLEKQASEREKAAALRKLSVDDFENAGRALRERLAATLEKYSSSDESASPESRHNGEGCPSSKTRTIKDRLCAFDSSRNKDTLSEKRSSTSSTSKQQHPPLCFRDQENRIDTSTPSERSSSPDSEYRVPRAAFHRSLDSLDADASSGPDTFERVQSLEELDYGRRYPASSSSAELLNDTDREDSGIHTADVSCSVSQADEPVDDEIVHANTILDRRSDVISTPLEEKTEQRRDALSTTTLPPTPATVGEEENVVRSEPPASASKTDAVSTNVPSVSANDVAPTSFASHQEAVVAKKEPIVIEEEDEQEAEPICPTSLSVQREERGKSETLGRSEEDAMTTATTMTTMTTVTTTATAPVTFDDHDSPTPMVPSIAPPPPERPANLTFEKSEVEQSSDPANFSPMSPNSKQILPLNLSSDEEIVAGLAFPLGPPTSVEPPKEKPPPPPVDVSDEDTPPVEPLKRLNSTRRIKKEIRSRRSDFLGIGGVNDDDLERELTLTKPPDMAAILAEERRIEQLHRRSYDTDSNYEQDSSHERDSGVELGHVEDWAKQPVSPDMSQHSRQSSEPFGTSVTSSEEDEITKKEREIIEVLEKEEQWRYGNEREVNSELGEKLARKLRELEEEKMQLERERAQEVALRRQEEALRKNEDNARKQREEALRRRQEDAERLCQRENTEVTQVPIEPEATVETMRAKDTIKEQEELRIQTEELRIQSDIDERERRAADARRKEEMRIRSMENKIHEQENGDLVREVDTDDNKDEFSAGEVLRVERELLQLEQEELRRQRSNLAYREQKQLHLEQLQEQWKSLQDVAQTSAANNVQRYKQQPIVNYRSSMPNLQLQDAQRRRPPPPPIPPAKPLRLPEHRQRDVTIRNSRIPSADSIPQQVDASLRHSASATSLSVNHANHAGQQMSRQTLQALSAVPRPRIVQGDQWVQRRKSDIPRGAHDYNYQHWLIQEAEQRRINEKNQRSPARKSQVHVTGTSVPYVGAPPRSDGKPLPDSIIQTLTQRVQNRVQEKPHPLRRRIEHSTSQEHLPSPVQHQSQHALQQPKSQQCPPAANNTETQEKMLSVSGKKKCSHCGDELGRGAAMIIESLRLFYHMECFKCCVCHVRLGDGLMGTDVRVRNHKLHCHNCYSSDDGVKFSCV